MCGIIGYSLAGGEAPNRVEFEAARDLLKHRGPDGAGTWVEGPVGLGHRRLSIIDIQGGAQPMAHRVSGCRGRPGSLVITYNGEIYNFQQLRRELEAVGHRFETQSDTEVILHLYEDLGEQCVTRLRGMFAFALYDTSRRELFLARDRLGVKPLVYAETPAGFFFASEIQAVLALGKIPRQIDLESLGLYLALQYIPSPQTGFAAVKKLPPGHTLHVREGRKTGPPRRYWTPKPTERWTGTYAEAQEALREKLAEATRLRLISDVPLGAFLSGGIDSSITVVEMAKAAGKVKTFSVGFASERFNELPFARMIAERYGTDHTEEMVEAGGARVLPELLRSFGEPFADHSAVPTYEVSAVARRRVTVALSGDGGDESFAGYKRYARIGLLDRLAGLGLLGAWVLTRRAVVAAEGMLNPRRRHLRFPQSVGDRVIGLKGIDRFLPLVQFFDRAQIEDLLTSEALRSSDPDAARRYLAKRWDEAEGSDVEKAMQTDLTTYLPEDILFKVDIASMRHSLEVRSPFLDHEVVEFAAGLPAGFKLGFPNTKKRILKDAYAKALPEAIRTKSKQGFTPPVGEWLRGDLRGTLESAISGGVPVFGQLIRRDAARRIFEEHQHRRRDHGGRLWALYVLARWLDEFEVQL